ncbi:MAG: sugar phosphate isomerase/epimerase [Clostridia bacterium]|nr:sugar phosphate isomerase/epimerase [Clostridia bacterium]
MDKRIGAQFYTVRDFCQTAEDLDATFEKVSSMGYKVAQMSGIGSIPAEEIKKSADKYNVEICCTHRGFDEFLPENIEKTIEFHKTIGCRIAGIGGLPMEYRGDVESIRKFIKQANKAAETLKENGLTFGYHNHCFEFIKFDGKYMMDYILEETNPEAFKFILDTYWLAYAGISVVDFMDKVSDRIAILHYKDLAIENGYDIIMAEIGSGNLDWDKIIAKSFETSAEFAVVEQDTCKGNPFDSLKISYDYLAKKGFC